MSYDNFPIPEIVFGIKREPNKTFTTYHSCGWVAIFGNSIVYDDMNVGPWYCPECGQEFGVRLQKEV